MTATTQPRRAVAWWSFREACWLCSIDGATPARFYNEADALAWAAACGAVARSGSLWSLEASA